MLPQTRLLLKILCKPEITIEVKPPRELNPRITQDCINLIHRGGQVALKGLPERFASSAWVAYAQNASQIVACTVLKNPEEHYRDSIFENAHLPGEGKNFPHELGFMFTQPRYRGQQVAFRLVGALLQKAKNVYAVVSTDNAISLYVLNKYDFKQVGVDFPNKDNKKRLILLIKKEKVEDKNE